jgi:predicted permease
MVGQDLVDGADMVCVMFNIVVLMMFGYAISISGPLGKPEQHAVLGMFITDLALPSLFCHIVAGRP